MSLEEKRKLLRHTFSTSTCDSEGARSLSEADLYTLTTTESEAYVHTISCTELPPPSTFTDSGYVEVTTTYLERKFSPLELRNASPLPVSPTIMGPEGMSLPTSTLPTSSTNHTLPSLRSTCSSYPSSSSSRSSQGSNKGFRRAQAKANQQSELNGGSMANGNEVTIQLDTILETSRPPSSLSLLISPSHILCLATCATLIGCFPIGLVALVKACKVFTVEIRRKVRRLYHRGEVDVDLSRATQCWSVLSLCVGIPCYLLLTILVVIAIVIFVVVKPFNL